MNYLMTKSSASSKKHLTEQIGAQTPNLNYQANPTELQKFIKQNYLLANLSAILTFKSLTETCESNSYS